MIINMTGGGAGLNFTVVGGTSQPSSASENTIWVNTSTSITSWVFSVEQPTNPVEGMVWFQTALKSNVPFNAVKKNGLVIYPIKCKQYVSGAWVNKTTKTYQDGAWAAWELIVFENGTWNGSYRFKALDGRNPTINNSGNPVTITQSSGGGHIEGIDVTNYSTLTLTFAVSGGPHFLYYGISSDTVWYDNNATSMLAYKTSIPSDNTKTTVTIDVSAVSGVRYFKVYWFQFNSVTFSLYELRLE